MTKIEATEKAWRIVATVAPRFYNKTNQNPDKNGQNNNIVRAHTREDIGTALILWGVTFFSLQKQSATLATVATILDGAHG